MKNLMPVGALLYFLINVSHLPAAEKWEGEDSFDNSQRWFPAVDRVDYGRIVNSEGRLIYSCAKEGRQWNGAAWLWGNSKKGMAVPTGVCWEVGCEITFPENSPTPNLSEAGVLVGVSAPGRPGYARAVYCGLYAFYDGLSRFAGSIQGFSDFNFEQRPGSDGGAPDKTDLVRTSSRAFILLLRHNALTQKDHFELKDRDAGLTICQRVENAGLSISPWVNFWISMGVDHFKAWPSLNNNFAVDNWHLRSFQPDPINLNSKTGTSGGNSYSTAVTNLGMTGTKLIGTVTLTVGTASASLPITGSIDKNGYFALTAKGTGANKGYGCVLLYDVAIGTYRPGKNSITAPKQKAIKF